MATATEVATARISLPLNVPSDPPKDLRSEAFRFVALMRDSLNVLNTNVPNFQPSHAYTVAEILALPLSTHRIPDQLHDLPRRKSAGHLLAVSIANLLFPVHDGSLTAVIRYEADRVRLRAWTVLQRKYDMLIRRARKTISGAFQDGSVVTPGWTARIMNQGRWNKSECPISLQGVKAIPMPVQVADEADLAPFLRHLSTGGCHLLSEGQNVATELEDGKGEPYYRVQAAEFSKGVVYEDGRMDLCKKVVGPDHIGKLMDSLRTNLHVRHFLLGNNIIGPSGAKAIASFVQDFPERIETWYLAGNCIDSESFTVLVDALVKSEAVRNVWLKRNPLGQSVAEDVFRLITQTVNLRMLDLDQTELGDEGVAKLFDKLTSHIESNESILPIQHLYLNGCGISVKGAGAIARFISSARCGLKSLYVSLNPLGDEGVMAIANALPHASDLTRLLLQSVGVGTQGAIELCRAASGHARLTTLDLGQAYATEDLEQAYNFIEDGAVSAMTEMIQSSPNLEYFNLGHCPISHEALRQLIDAVQYSNSLLYYQAISVLSDPDLVKATFVPTKKDARLPDLGSLPHVQVEGTEALRAHLEANVRRKYGADTTYYDFMEGEKRWLVSDKDVRKIDSVYRNRDASQARRGLMTLVKDWKEGDDTLEKVAAWPSCSLKRQ